MPRVCFTLQVRPDRLAEYRERHAAVWPEMLRALRDAGWRDYQLFLREDGLLVGTVVTDDLAAAQAAMNATAVSARWEAEMAEFFELPNGRDGRDKAELDLVFEAAELRADPGLTLLLATAEPASPTEAALDRLSAAPVE